MKKNRMVSNFGSDDAFSVTTETIVLIAAVVAAVTAVTFMLYTTITKSATTVDKNVGDALQGFSDKFK